LKNKLGQWLKTKKTSKKITIGKTTAKDHSGGGLHDERFAPTRNSSHLEEFAMSFRKTGKRRIKGERRDWFARAYFSLIGTARNRRCANHSYRGKWPTSAHSTPFHDAKQGKNTVRLLKQKGGGRPKNGQNEECLRNARGEGFSISNNPPRDKPASTKTRDQNVEAKRREESLGNSQNERLGMHDASAARCQCRRHPPNYKKQEPSQ